MKKTIFTALIALFGLASHAEALVCPGGSPFELRRPVDNVPIGCIDNAGNAVFGSSFTTGGTFYGDGSGLTNVAGSGGGHNIQVSTDGIVGSELTTEPTRAGLAFGPSFTLNDDAGKDANIVTIGGTSAKINYTCPSGFTAIEIGTSFLGCMQTAEEGTGGWYAANSVCSSTYGGRLPSKAEWHAAMDNFNLIDETDAQWEWLDDGNGTNASIVIGNASITATGFNGDATVYDYRCWIPKPDHTVSAVISNGQTASEVWHVVETRELSASAEETFAGFLPGENYRVMYDLQKDGGDGAMRMRVNADATAVYHNFFRAGRDDGTITSDVGTVETRWEISGTLQIEGDTATPVSGSFDIASTHQDSGRIILRNASLVSFGIGGSQMHHTHGGGEYNGSDFTSLQFGVSAGTLSGTIKILKLGPAIALVQNANDVAISIPGHEEANLDGFSTSPSVIGKCVAGSTVTLTGTTFDMTFAGSACDSIGCNSAKPLDLYFLVDGEFIDGTATTVVESQTTGSVSQGANLSATRRVTLASGSHNFCMSVDGKGAGNDVTQCALGGTCRFQVSEVRNTAGTGDVASNGNNTYSGLNNFVGGGKGTSDYFTSLTVDKGPTDNYSCAVTALGRVYCWGYNIKRTVATNPATANPHPQMINFSEDVFITKVYSGSGTVYALTDDGDVWAWGRCSVNGECGSNGVAITSGPVKIPIVSNVVDVAHGGGNYTVSHACALQSDGDLYCFGYNVHGQLGVGDNVTKTIPTLAASNVAQVAAGGSNNGYTCIIDTSNVMKCAGSNVTGNLGVGDAISKNVFTTVLAIADPVASMSLNHGYQATAHHTCATTTNGKLYCWGYNAYGQACTGNVTSPQTSPVLVLASGAKAVYAGGANIGSTLITKTDDTLWQCGHSGQGQSGDGGTANNLIPTQVSGNPTVSFAMLSGGEDASGYTTSCSISLTGNLSCWGYNGYGNNANGKTGNGLVPQPSWLFNAVDLSTYGSTSSHGWCALTDTGEVYCWGYGLNGENGDGTLVHGYNPKRVRLP